MKNGIEITQTMAAPARRMLEEGQEAFEAISLIHLATGKTRLETAEEAAAGLDTAAQCVALQPGHDPKLLHALRDLAAEIRSAGS